MPLRPRADLLSQSKLQVEFEGCKGVSEQLTLRRHNFISLSFVGLSMSNLVCIMDRL